MSTKDVKVVLVRTLSARQACRVADHVTPDDLIARLLSLHGVASLDDLHGRIPNSLRTLKRWKSTGWPQSARAALAMLNEAGYLTDEEPEPAKFAQAKARKVAQRLANDAEELLRLL